MQQMKQGLIIAFLFSSMLFALPAKALTDMDEKPVTIDGLIGKGKWSVFEIWASDCRMCRASIYETVNFETANPDVDVYGISLDGVTGKTNAERFIDEYGLTFPNLLSTPSEIDTYLYSTAKESFIGTPTFMVFDPQGKLRVVQPGTVSEEALSNFIKQQDAQEKPAP